MTVTNREAEQWNRVAHAAAVRRATEARRNAVAPILAARGIQMKPATTQTTAKQGRLFR